LGQYNLGLSYEGGVGVPKNLTEAYKWYNLSSAQGESAAATRRDRIAARMTAAEIAEGQRLAAEWRPR
jgi:TPR repeat protein